MRPRERSDVVKMSTDILKCSQCNIVINELLCFVQNKIDVMDEESLIRLSVGSFSEMDIKKAKELLFMSITTTVKNTSRRKNKANKGMEDIICIFKNTDPESTPIFVAKELHKLPPVTFDHIDATRLLKDIIMLQTEVKNIKEMYATNEEVEGVKQQLKYINQLNDSNLHKNVNKKRGGYYHNSEQDDFLNTSSTLTINNSTLQCNVVNGEVSDCRSPLHMQGMHSMRHNDSSVAPSIGTNHSGQQSHACVTHTYQLTDRGAEEHLIDETTAHTVPNIVDSANVRKINTNICKSMAEVLESSGEWKKEEPTREWVQVQRKRHRNKTDDVRGKAIIKSDDKFRSANIKVSLFVSNVHQDTTEKDICDYILSKTKENVLLQKIKMKQQRGYNAFKIIVARHKLNLFLNDELWPDGVICRRFMPYKIMDKKRELQTINERELNV